MSAIDRIRREILTFTTARVNDKKQKSLKDERFTLISNNCTGGVLLHDFGKRFDTPLINCGLYAEDFVRLSLQFPQYMQEELRPHEKDFGYPAARLGDLCLRFPHDSDFEEVKRNWDRRKQRIHYDNVFVLWVGYGSEMQESLLPEFAKVPYPKAVFLAHENKDFPFCFRIKNCSYLQGLGHVWQNEGLSGKKYYDQFDVVSWIKKKEKMEDFL